MSPGYPARRLPILSLPVEVRNLIIVYRKADRFCGIVEYAGYIQQQVLALRPSLESNPQSRLDGQPGICSVRAQFKIIELIIGFAFLSRVVNNDPDQPGRDNKIEDHPRMAFPALHLPKIYCAEIGFTKAGKLRIGIFQCMHHITQRAADYFQRLQGHALDQSTHFTFEFPASCTYSSNCETVSSYNPCGPFL